MNSRAVSSLEGLLPRWKVSSNLSPKMVILNSVFEPPAMINVMSRHHQIFQQYVAAVDALRTCFEDHQEALAQTETILQYAFSTEVQTFTWLQQHLAPLASLLLPARFVMRLVVKVADYQVELHI